MPTRTRQSTQSGNSQGSARLKVYDYCLLLSSSSSSASASNSNSNNYYCDHPCVCNFCSSSSICIRGSRMHVPQANAALQNSALQSQELQPAPQLEGWDSAFSVARSEGARM